MGLSGRREELAPLTKEKNGRGKGQLKKRRKGGGQTD